MFILFFCLLYLLWLCSRAKHRGSLWLRWEGRRKVRIFVSLSLKTKYLGKQSIWNLLRSTWKHYWHHKEKGLINSRSFFSRSLSPFLFPLCILSLEVILLILIPAITLYLLLILKSSSIAELLCLTAYWAPLFAYFTSIM